MVKARTAATSTRRWVVDGSAVKGQQMLDRQLKLMLRAFNGECDAAVAKVRFNNIAALETRMQKSFDAVNQLGASNECAISEDYMALKKAELRLAHEHAEKLQAEREEQRLIREQMREEELVRREREEQQREAELEEQRVAAALEKARAQLLGAAQRDQERLNAKVAALEAQLAEAHASTVRAVSQAQLTRAGHVYVISNEGSFGPNVFKVGMTRRLDPEERLRELSGAAVPFIFDVHAMIYSEDAPSLENQLHNALTAARVNLVNERKEFFAVSLDEIDDAVTKCLGGRASFTRIAVAEEFRKSQAIRAERAAGATREAQRLAETSNAEAAAATWMQRLAV